MISRPSHFYFFDYACNAASYEDGSFYFSDYVFYGAANYGDACFYFSDYVFYGAANYGDGGFYFLAYFYAL